MTRSIMMVFAALAVFGSAFGVGQEPSASDRQPSSGRFLPQVSRSEPQQATAETQAEAVIRRAADANKYVFLFFWREKNRQTDAAWSVFQPTMTKLAQSADWTTIQVTDPAEKPVVGRFGLSRAPMPFVLALAPNGAITKGIASKCDETQLKAALVSPCTEVCLKSLQTRKLVLLCVQDSPTKQGQVMVPQGVADFRDDPRFADATEIVVLNPRETAEAAFLKELQIDSQARNTITVLLAPPGTVVGKFEGNVSKEQLVAKLAAAQSNPCAGGKCGPNGCGPKR